MPITKPRAHDAGDIDLGVLSIAERLFLWRHRQPAPDGRLMGRSGSAMSQEEAAVALGLDPSVYHRMENGAEPHDPVVCADCGSVVGTEDARAVGAAFALARAVDPTPAELCVVARRRSGRSLTDVCDALGVSRPTFHAWERAADPRLVAWWEGMGFAFPRK